MRRPLRPTGLDADAVRGRIGAASLAAHAGGDASPPSPLPWEPRDAADRAIA
jgi:hypothetical protein